MWYKVTHTPCSFVKVCTILKQTKFYSQWFNSALGYGFELIEDYTPYAYVHPQNKQEIQDYWLTLDMAKEVSMLSKAPNGKELRKYLIFLDNKKTEGLLLSHEEILELNPLIEASFFVEFREKARDSHLSLYLPPNPKGKDYAIAHNKRKLICGIDKEEIVKRLHDVNERSKSVQKDLIRLDKYELIRIFVIDCMLFFGKSKEYAINLGDLCKKMAIKNERANFDRANTMYLVPKEYMSTIAMLK